MDGDEKYRHTAQQRGYRVLKALIGQETEGVTVAGIAAALRLSQPNVLRDLRNLRLAGLAEQITTTGRWRLGPTIPQAGVAMLNGVSRAQDKLDEVKHRFTRLPS